MAQGGTRVMHQRRLRAELRRIREGAGCTQKSVAEAMGWSTSKVIRMETGVVNVSTSDVMALLLYYGITEPDRTEELLAISRTKEEMWWDRYREFSTPDFFNFLDYENSASEIRHYVGFVLPGLLQTEDYARAVISGQISDPEGIEREVQIRLRRQELLANKEGLRAWYIIDEAALHRWIGGREVLMRQLVVLKEMTEWPNLSIRVVPHTVGMHPGLMRRSFMIFDFSADDEESIVNIEDPHKDKLIQVDQATNSEFVKRFQALEDVAADEAESGKLIDSALERVRMST
ncbi:MAG: helix-turn-helix domain-containing protein [Actinophytocola sp.]|uniref:helix-turn-helix domain-containing protein n=1 Tax=Actinophytocola sp. TaxID=1872138 RepID=UPI003D6A3BB1